MKYITTDKHPEFKEGLFFEAEYDAYFVLDRNRIIDEDLKYGYIKEVEEKEFTKSDMVSFARMFFLDFTGDYYDDKFCKKLLEQNWLKEREK